nr:MAG TPA: tail tape measure protein [Caudoviricetes sp.]
MGEALSDWYEQHGIDVYDKQTGQIRSLYEILSDLAPKWEGLTKNEQAYYLNQQAGANQTQNLAAILENFQVAIDATSTALNDSYNSALKENEAFMDSIAAKQTALNATFEEFANNIISSDLVKNVLDLANGFLKLANTDLGQIVSQILLLTGVGWGATSLLNVSKIIPTVVGQFTTFAEILGMVTTQGGLMNNVLGAGSLVISNFGSVALPVIGILASVAVGVYAIYKAWKETHPSLEEANNQLKTNKERLEEINNLPWNERTEEILKEKEALEKENKELEKYLNNLDKTKKSGEKGYTLSTGKTGWVRKDTRGVGADVYYGLDEITDDDIKQYQKLGYAFEQVAGKATYAGNELKTKLTENVKLLTTAMENGSIETLEYAGVINDETVSALTDLSDEYDWAKDLLNELTSATENYSNESKILSNSLEIEESQYKQLLKLHPQIANSIQKINNTYYLEEAQISSLIETSDQYINGRITNEYNLTKEIIEQSKLRIKTLESEMKALEAVMNSSDSIESAYGEKQYYRKLNELNDNKKALEEAQGTLTGLLSGLTWNRASGRTRTKGTKTKTTTSKDTTDKKLESLKNVVSLRESELDLLEESGASEEKQAQKMLEIQKALHNQAQYMRSIGASQEKINVLSVKWWQYQKKITNQTEKQIKYLEKYISLLSDRRDELSNEADIYNNVINDYIDKQIAALEEQKNVINEQNDALEDQIQKEQALNDLAKAKSKKLLVYRDGQFRYEEDIDAISSAQSTLDEIRRQENIDKEIKALDNQINKWENYRTEWNNAVKNINKSQQEILKEQQLLSRLDNDRLNSLSTYINEYRKLIAQIKSTESEIASAEKQKESLSSQNTVKDIDAQIQANSKAWHSASESERRRLEQANKSLYAQRDYITGDKHTYNPASGKWSYASGTLSASGGLSLVGEQGPELRVLNQGDGIIPSDITQNLWDWGKVNPKSMMSTMSQVFNIDNLSLPNATDANSLITGLKQMAYQRAYKRA